MNVYLDWIIFGTLALAALGTIGFFARACNDSDNRMLIERQAECVRHGGSYLVSNGQQSGSFCLQLQTPPR